MSRQYCACAHWPTPQGVFCWRGAGGGTHYPPPPAPHQHATLLWQCPWQCRADYTGSSTRPGYCAQRTRAKRGRLGKNWSQTLPALFPCGSKLIPPIQCGWDPDRGFRVPRVVGESSGCTCVGEVYSQLPPRADPKPTTPTYIYTCDYTHVYTGVHFIEGLASSG